MKKIKQTVNEALVEYRHAKRAEESAHEEHLSAMEYRSRRYVDLLLAQKQDEKT